MFFGTPHTGADGADFQRALTNAMNLFVQASSTKLRNLERDSEYLRDLSTSYLPTSPRLQHSVFLRGVRYPFVRNSLQDGKVHLYD